MRNEADYVVVMVERNYYFTGARPKGNLDSHTNYILQQKFFYVNKFYQVMFSGEGSIYVL
ncbi:MAG: hypothetical protein DRP92_07925 [Candidatus Neomarinimicrobiota bacterium]|nr:MAG: hypothetical protein DRP92_07925 [Candidatus Neomarinimicrobiota bacterium]